jgi:Tfp pilus assembly ATPase PilU
MDNPITRPSIGMVIGRCGSGKSTYVANLIIARRKSATTENDKEKLVDL